MSDFAARLGMLRGSLPTVARGGKRGVSFRLGELNELLVHRQQLVAPAPGRHFFGFHGSSMDVGKPTRMKKRAKAWERCSR